MEKVIGRDKFLELYNNVIEMDVSIYSKDEKYKWVWKSIGFFLLIFSGGKMKDFYKRFTTTIGDSIFFYALWDMGTAGIRAYVTLCHELDHVFQARNEGLFKFAIKYLFSKSCRCNYEREAYLSSIVALWELEIEVRLEWYVEVLSGPSYLYACQDKDALRTWFQDQLNAMKITYE